MRKAKYISILLLLLFTLPVLLNTTIVMAQPQKGPRVNKLVFIEYGDNPETALLDVLDGKAHTFVWGVPKELYEKYKNDGRVKFFLIPSGIHSFLLNAYASKDVFNPFSIRKIRYAMNFLLDREWYINQILGGLGIPMYTAISEASPDYLTILPAILKHNFRYDEDYALKLIEEGMKEANESGPWAGKIAKKNGKWYYDGHPITIIAAIRSDDARRKAMGEHFANQLEKAGFTVEKKYGTFRELIPEVYSGDPSKLKWEFYTEGFGGGFSRYNDWDPIFFYTTAYWTWQFGTPPMFNGSLVRVKYLGREMSLDEVAKILGEGTYMNKEERDEAMRVICDTGMSESVRIFMANLAEAYAVNSKVKNPVIDYGYGTGNRWFFMSAVPENGDTLVIAMLHATETDPWNWANNDWYTHIMWFAVYDAGVARHPHNGEVIPMDADYKVETKGPEGKFTVPETAILWDPFQGKWVSPSKLSDEFIKAFYDGDKAKATHAKSKVIFTYKFHRFHDGSMESLADILYSLYFNWQWAVQVNETDPTYDPSMSSSLLSLMSQIRGIEVLGENKIAVYIDYWHFDSNEIAAQADVYTSSPWQLQWAEEELVKSGAYSWTQKEIAPRIDEKNPDHAKSIKEFLVKAAESGMVPAALKQLADKGIISLSDAGERYKATESFIEKYNHAIIGNGPFFVTKIDFVGKRIEMEAWRDSTYPWTVGSWDKFTKLEKAEIAKVTLPDTIIQGVSSKIIVDITGTTTDNLAVVSMLVTDAEGNVVYSTDTYKVVDKDTIEIPVKIDKTGLYTVRVAVSAKDVVVPSIKEVPLKVSAVEPYLRSLQKELNNAKKEITKLEAEKAQLETQLQEVKVKQFNKGRSEGYYQGIYTGLIVGLIVGAVVFYVAIKLLSKKAKPAK